MGCKESRTVTVAARRLHRLALVRLTRLAAHTARRERAAGIQIGMQRWHSSQHSCAVMGRVRLLIQVLLHWHNRVWRRQYLGRCQLHSKGRFCNLQCRWALRLQRFSSISWKTCLPECCPSICLRRNHRHHSRRCCTQQMPKAMAQAQRQCP